METSDEALAALAANGDRQAFRSLLERHYQRIFRVSFRVLGDRADAEDVAQAVCEALPGKLASFGGRARFATWLHRLVVNRCRDLIRSRRRDRRKAEAWGEAEVLARAETGGKRSDLEWLYAAMAVLPPKLRETVALVLGEDMTHAEAATALEVSEGTVSWRMSEVKNHLREMAVREEMLR
ncbi:MAG: RNA polymerase sigma factor [Paracoccaceae bacterium]